MRTISRTMPKSPKIPSAIIRSETGNHYLYMDVFTL